MQVNLTNLNIATQLRYCRGISQSNILMWSYSYSSLYSLKLFDYWFPCRILISLCISKAIWLCKNTRFVCPPEPGFTKREKKRSLLKSLKILYVKKMSQRQKGMQNS